MRTLRGIIAATLTLIAGAAYAGPPAGLAELKAEGAQIEADAQQLADDKRELAAGVGQLGEIRQQLDQRGAELSAAIGQWQPQFDAVNREIDDYNAQCAGELPEPQYSRCV